MLDALGWIRDPSTPHIEKSECATGLLPAVWKKPDIDGKSAENERHLEDPHLAKMIVAAQGGDKRLYAELLAICEGRIRATARHAGVKGYAIEIAVQETLITLHHARHTYDPTRSFTAWLTALSKKCAINLLSRQGAEQTKTSVRYSSFDQQT